MEVIKEVVKIQLEALKSILKNPDSVDRHGLKTYLQISGEEITEATNKLIDEYNQIYKYPWLIRQLSEYQLMVCSHILFNIEDEYIQEYPESVSKAWELIMKAQENNHPEFKIIIGGRYNG